MSIYLHISMVALICATATVCESSAFVAPLTIQNEKDIARALNQVDLVNTFWRERQYGDTAVLYNHPYTRYFQEKPGITADDCYTIIHDVPDVALFLESATPDDVIFWDYDNVLVTLQSNALRTHRATVIKPLFQEMKTRSINYVVSMGNAFHFDHVFDETNELVNAQLYGQPFNKPSQDQGPFNDYENETAIGYNEKVSIFGFPVMSYIRRNDLYCCFPQQGSFHLQVLPRWQPDIPYKAPDQTNLSVHLSKQANEYFFDILRSTSKGRGLAWMLQYLYRTQSLPSTRRDVYFIDDNEINCRAFLYYARLVRDLGLFTGKIRVVHYTGDFDRYLCKSIQVINKILSPEPTFHPFYLPPADA